MTEIYNRSRPTIDHLQTASQLSPESIFSGMQARCEIAFRHVLQQCLVGMASFEESLPDVVMGVDETGRDYLVCAVDHFATWWWGDVLCYHRDFRSGYQNVGSDCIDFVIFAVDERCAVLEQDMTALSRHREVS